MCVVVKTNFIMRIYIVKVGLHLSNVQELLQTMPMITQVIEATLDVKINFDPNELSSVEQAINTEYPIGHQPLQTTILSFGLYLGEVFVKNHNGIWCSSEDDIRNIHFKIREQDKEFIGFPIKRMSTFWFDRAYSLSSYYQMNMDVIQGKINPVADGKWKSNDGEYMYRFS